MTVLLVKCRQNGGATSIFDGFIIIREQELWALVYLSRSVHEGKERSRFQSAGGGLGHSRRWTGLPVLGAPSHLSTAFSSTGPLLLFYFYTSLSHYVGFKGQHRVLLDLVCLLLGGVHGQRLCLVCYFCGQII